MIQLWVNLPARHKNARPGYQTLLARQIPNVSLPKNAGTVRVIAGEFEGQKGPAKTFTPIDLWDVNLKEGGTVRLRLVEAHTAAILVLKGSVTVNENSKALEGDLIQFARGGEQIRLGANADAALLVLSGEPIDEPIVGHGPFVMNTQAEIRKAFEDFQLGRMGEISA